MRLLVGTFSFVLLVSLTLSYSVAKQEARKDVQVESTEAVEVQEAEVGDQAEAIETPDFSMVDQFESMQQEGLNNELKMLAEQFDVEEAIITQLKKDLGDEVKKTAEKMGQNTDGMVMFTATLEDDLLAEIWSQFREKLPEEQRADFDQYTQEVEKLNKRKAFAAQRGVVAYLDDMICMTDEQFQQLLKYYEENWNASWTEYAAMMAMNGPSIVGDLFSQLNEVDFLNQDQKSLLENMEAFSNPMFNAMNGQAEGVDPEAFKERCAQIMDLRLKLLKTMTEIDDKDLKMLAFAQKGAIAKSATEWQKVMEKASRMNPAGAPDLDVMSEATKPILLRVTEQPTWQKTIKKVVPEEVLKKIKERQEVKSTYIKEQMAEYLIFALFEQMNNSGRLPPKQHNELFEMLMGEQDMKHHADAMGAIYSVFSIPDEKFEAILTEEQYAPVIMMLDQQRQMIEDAKEKATEEESDNE